MRGFKSGDFMSLFSSVFGRESAGKDAKSANGMSPEQPSPSPLLSPTTPFESPSQEEPASTFGIPHGIKGEDDVSETAETTSAEQAGVEGQAVAEGQKAEGSEGESSFPVAGSEEALRSLYRAPQFHVDRTEVVDATEIEIQAAIVVLQARSRRFGPPVEVSAYPFNAGVGWRQAALNFIRKNREEAAKGNPTWV